MTIFAVKRKIWRVAINEHLLNFVVNCIMVPVGGQSPTTNAHKEESSCYHRGKTPFET